MNKEFEKNMRQLAHDRLNQFINESILNYAHQRNFDFGKGNHNKVSCLSHFIRKRLISEERVVKKILSSFDFCAVEKYIQEVCWRTYWKGWLCHYPSVWDNYRSELDQLLKNADATVFSKIKSLEMLNSELECLNDWSEELQETGYLHNHARMWFASIWVHTLQLPWQLGAHFFMRHLLDGDEASNTLSWRWVAGLHTKGKCYLATESNIRKFTKSRYDKLPRLAKQAITIDDGKLYQQEIVSFDTAIHAESKISLIVHGNDCEQVTELLQRYNVDSIYVLPLRQVNSKIDVYSEKVLEFDDAVIDETVTSIKQSSSARIKTIDDSFQYDPSRIYAAYFPGQGYVMDYLSYIIKDVHYLYKPWDSSLFPYANKGFFPFWKKAKHYIKSEALK